MLGSERVDFAELEGDCAGSSPRAPSIHRSLTLLREFLFELENAGHVDEPKGDGAPGEKPLSMFAHGK
jgi:hypothetical protein